MDEMDEIKSAHAGVLPREYDPELIAIACAVERRNIAVLAERGQVRVVARVGGVPVVVRIATPQTLAHTRNESLYIVPATGHWADWSDGDAVVYHGVRVV